jgi:hypothetical protein
MRSTKKLIASLFASGLLVVGIAAPTASAQPVVTGGLVNVTVVDVIDDVTVIVRDVNVGVGVAANVAAALCDTADVNAAVLAQQVVRGGDTVNCDTSTGNITFSPVQR